MIREVFSTPFVVSIRAPREGRDMNFREQSRDIAQFQSARPVKGATVFPGPYRTAIRSFNPRAP